MKIVWTKSAKEDLANYRNESKILDVEKYIEKLIDYVDELESHPRLGKKLFNIRDKEIRQLIYKMHKILYIVEDEKIMILVVVHVHRDMNFIVKFLKQQLLN
ncbi:MAG: type II toxin-antitoxin system RelE/ParE family toxin [Clostridia bacterium]|nr:type II toxin-antitoxin system RelE/ParE family toxin [Clostridia bacterium]